MRPWLPKKLERLDELAALEENWDSYHANPIKPEAIDAGRRLLAVLAALIEVAPTLQTQIVPTVDGGLQFVWREGGWDLDISVEPDGKLNVWAWSKDRGVEFSFPDEDGGR